MPAGSRRAPRGMALVGVLLLLALCMLGLSAAGPLWRHEVQRDREQELLRVGALYAQALASYYHRSPGGAKQFPARLEDLVDDPRHPVTVRHIRQLYPDPVNRGQPWGLLRNPQHGIVGVYSLSTEAPVIERPVDLGVLVLPQARHYTDWKFVPHIPSP